jgi:Protein of unknown function (DUF1573).
MKRYCFLLLITLLFSCSENKKQNISNKKTTLSFNKTCYDFGNLKEDEVYNGYFIVKNTGSNDLILYDVKAECGCTLVNSYKNLIRPKDTSIIRFAFSTMGKSGVQNKTITINANTDSATYHLKLRACVN